MSKSWSKKHNTHAEDHARIEDNAYTGDSLLEIGTKLSALSDVCVKPLTLLLCIPYWPNVAAVASFGLMSRTLSLWFLTDYVKTTTKAAKEKLAPVIEERVAAIGKRKTAGASVRAEEMRLERVILMNEALKEEPQNSPSLFAAPGRYSRLFQPLLAAEALHVDNASMKQKNIGLVLDELKEAKDVNDVDKLNAAYHSYVLQLRMANYRWVEAEKLRASAYRSIFEAAAKIEASPRAAACSAPTDSTPLL